MKKVAFCTLGCKVNQYDTQAMAEILEGAGYRTVPFSEKADVYIINTCTVTNIADRKSRQMISRARAANPGAVICVCGCLSQSSPEEILAIEGVTCVAGTAKRSDILKVIESAGNHVDAAGSEFEDLSVSRSGVRTRANIKIQEGCDNYCSYCIIPFVRGHERSRALDSIMDEARRLADNGVSEIVLGGIHVSSYMSADGSDLADTVGMLNSIDGIRRIRLGSLEQPALKEDFIKRLAECQPF